MIRLSFTSSPLCKVTDRFLESVVGNSRQLIICLTDMQHLRTELYSAAEYFELSYTYDDQKQIVAETLKDYAIRALVNTVDHLDSVTYKVNGVIMKRLKKYMAQSFLSHVLNREYTDREGLAQQPSMIDAPRYHKRYNLPGEEAIEEAIEDNIKYHGCTLEDENEWHQYRSATCTNISETPSSSSTSASSSSRKVHFVSPSLRPSRPPSNSSRSGSNLKKEHVNESLGTTPPKLAKLKRIQDLHLDRNKLQGIVHCSG